MATEIVTTVKVVILRDLPSKATFDMQSQYSPDCFESETLKRSLDVETFQR